MTDTILLVPTIRRRKPHDSRGRSEAGHVSENFHPCAFSGCRENSKASGAARGYCQGHYQQLRRHGLDNLAPLAPRNGLLRAATNVSLHAWDTVAEFAERANTNIYEATRQILASELHKYARGLPDRVVVARGDSSNVLQTRVELETLVELTKVGRLSGGKDRGYAMQQIFERYALTHRTKVLHEGCHVCKAL